MEEADENESGKTLCRSVSMPAIAMPSANSKFAVTQTETVEEPQVEKLNHDMGKSAALSGSASMVAEGGLEDPGRPNANPQYTSMLNKMTEKVRTVENDHRVVDSLVTTGIVEEARDKEQHHLEVEWQAASIPIKTAQEIGNAEQGRRIADSQNPTELERDIRDTAHDQARADSHSVLVQTAVVEESTVEEVSEAKTLPVSKEVAKKCGKVGQTESNPACLQTKLGETACVAELGCGMDVSSSLSKAKKAAEGTGNKEADHHTEESTSTSHLSDEVEESYVAEINSDMDKTTSLPAVNEIVEGAVGEENYHREIDSKSVPKVTEVVDEPHVEEMNLDFSNEIMEGSNSKKDAHPKMDSTSNLTEAVTESRAEEADLDTGKSTFLEMKHEIVEGAGGEDDGRLKLHSELKLAAAVECLAEEGDRTSRRVKNKVRGERQSNRILEFDARHSKASRGRDHGRRGGHKPWQARRTWRSRKDFEEKMRRTGLFEGNSAMQYLYCDGRNHGLSPDFEFGPASGTISGFGEILEPYDDRVLREANWAYGTPAGGMGFRFAPVYLLQNNVVPNMFVIYFSSGFEMQSTLCWDGPPPQSDGFCYSISFASGQVFYVHACHVLPPMAAAPF